MNRVIFFKLNNLVGRSKKLDRFFIFWARDFVFYFTIFLGILFLVPSLAKIFGLSRYSLIAIGLISTFSWVAAVLIKTLHFTERPYLNKKTKILLKKKKNDPAFPSGHAAPLFAAGTIIFYFSPIFGSVVLVMGLIVGICRIITGLHWPIDIVGGAVLGWLLSFLLYSFL
ncbi:MAG: phosphatase PAP2 family protein [Candidatus Paceibacterota bacterium]|jgi:undecaprenyl-diphosphatase